MKLVFVLGWFCLCLYLVQRVDDNPLVPVKYRSTIQVASLFVGPLIFLGLRLLDSAGSGKLGGIVDEGGRQAKEPPRGGERPGERSIG